MNGRRIYWLGLCLWSAFGLVLQIKAQESGDGFTSSDRRMLQEIHTRTASIKNDTTAIRQDVTAIRNDVGDISDAVDDLLDYASGHSDSLHDIYQDTQWLRTMVGDQEADLSGIYGNSTYLPIISSTVSSILHQLQYLRGDISDIPDDITQINGHLLNIDRETTESSDYLYSIDLYIKALLEVANRISTNNVGVGDDVVVALTNALSLYQSRPVDLSMVTNLATYLVSFSDVADWRNFDSFPLYSLLYDYMEQLYGDELDMPTFRAFWAQSPLGFLIYLYQSALFTRHGSTGVRSFDAAWDIWHNSSYFSLPRSDYTIFDAYNTLGLGVLTNQMITVSNVLGEVRDLLASNVSQVVKVNTSIGYDDSQDEDLNLEHGDDSRLPEWEERYQGHLSNWTNSYYYESIFQGSYSRMAEASNVVNDFFNQLDQSPGDFHHTLTWSGLSFGRDNPIGGWDLNVTISKDDPNYADVRSFTNGVFSVSMAFLNLCIVAYFMRRIYGKLMKSPLL